jgi:hypothetical protein
MNVGEFYGPTSASVTSVTASATSQILLRGNDNRHGALFFNHSTAALFLKFGNGASVTDFTVKLSSGSYYEMPRPIHTGSITGVHDAAAGSVKITEL